jgi:hypothetical protein
MLLKSNSLMRPSRLPMSGNINGRAGILCTREFQFSYRNLRIGSFVQAWFARGLSLAWSEDAAEGPATSEKDAFREAVGNDLSAVCKMGD